jgi:hypothetical protein
MLAVAAYFLCSMCPTLSPVTPSQPAAYACFTPCTTDTATTLYSVDAPPASITSILMCSPGCFLSSAFSAGVPRCIACLVLPTRSAMNRFPFLVCMSLPRLHLLPVLLLPHLLTVMAKVPFCVSPPCPALVCVLVMPSFLSSAKAFLACTSPSRCPADWQPRMMPSRVWLKPICFF